LKKTFKSISIFIAALVLVSTPIELSSNFIFQNCPLTVNARVASTDLVFENLYYTIETDSSGEYIKINGSKDKSDIKSIVIPEEIDGKKVKVIGESAFEGYVLLDSISLPNSIEVIKENAFAFCHSLKKITFPSNLKIIDFAFIDSGLTEISIPDSVTSMKSAFQSCKLLTKINLSENIENINYAFSNCYNLSEITLPSKIKTMDYAFNGCKSITKISIPDSVESMNYSFYGCVNLTDVNIPTKVTNLIGTFKDCINLKDVVLHSSILELSDTFNGCISLEIIDIPNSVTKMTTPFDNCISLNQLSTPESVSEITINNCFNLKQINLNSATKLNLLNCSDLLINYIDTNKTEQHIEFTNSYDDKNLIEKDGIIYKIINESYATIVDSNKSLKEVTIPGEIEGFKVFTISENAFRNNTNLEKLIFSDEIVGIDIMDFAFKGCTNLKEITNTERLSSIGAYAFAYCTSLNSLNLEYTLDIKEYAFAYCNNLSSVSLNDTSLDFTAFSYCKNLSKISLRDLRNSSHRSDYKNFYTSTNSIILTNDQFLLDYFHLRNKVVDLSFVLLGDINIDGNIDNLDLVTLGQYLLKDIVPYASQEVNSDINSDGSVDIADMAILKQHLMGDTTILKNK